jgi:transketolase
MATETVFYVEGKSSWAKLNDKNMSTKYGPKYVIDLAPSEKGLATLNAHGLSEKAKKREDGSTFFQFKRDKFVSWNDKKTGALIQKERGAPELVDKDGKALPADTLIGNGSDVILKLAVKDSPKGLSTRLEKVMIVSLVPFNSKEVIEDNPDNLPF